jgi:hypothetical protein
LTFGGEVDKTTRHQQDYILPTMPSSLGEAYSNQLEREG